MTAEEFLVKKYEELEEENKQLRSENKELGEAYLNQSKILIKLKEIGRKYCAIDTSSYDTNEANKPKYIYTSLISARSDKEDFEFLKLALGLEETIDLSKESKEEE